jgi:3-hydroxyisobutyrate dehydrogenase-like beta-hydroxyacid dehydrogenase
MCPMKVALLGLGNMGIGVARSLLAKRHELTVWNRTPARALPVVAEGAHAAATIREAVSGADIVLTLLADDNAVKSVVEGPDGLLAHLGHEAVHVSLSTIGVELSRKLAAAHSAASQGYVAAPVFGRPAAAANGQLLVVAAGPPEQVARATPVLEAFSRQIVTLGTEPHQANVVKLAGNFVIASLIETLGEAFALVRRHDVDPGVFLETVNGGLFQSPVYKTYGTIIAERKFSPPGFALPLGLKDVRLVLGAADAAGVPMPLASLLHDRLLAAISRGKGELDWSALAELIAEDAGL